MPDDATIELACELIRRRSVTPDDAGCQALIGERLERAGFRVEQLPFGDVSNLWATCGESGPLLCFAGHTDVVPPGPAERWSSEAFTPTLRDGLLYGRGAADMKGSVAAMVTALERLAAAQPGIRLALLLTSDEEGPAVNGTRRVLDTLVERGERIDYCVVGEPSSATALGDTIKHGRRGSLTGRITVQGRQGHVAYPQNADNALHALLPTLTELIGVQWDTGDADFPPTSFQISNLNAGTGADNVIPGSAEACFNLRYAPSLDADTIRARITEVCQRHGLTPNIDWHHSGKPFLTQPGVLVDAVQAALIQHCGQPATLSTGGGTSDGRFIAPTGAQVVELGPINASIHQIDEHVRVADLTLLATLYEDIARRVAAA